MDYPKGEKLVFYSIDSHLVVFDWASQRSGYDSVILHIRSMHYLSQGFVFLVWENMDVGVLSLDPDARVTGRDMNWIRFPLSRLAEIIVKLY